MKLDINSDWVRKMAEKEDNAMISAGGLVARVKAESAPRPRVSGALMRAVRRYGRAAVDLSWLGAADPEDWEAIRQEYRAAHDGLLAALAELEAATALPPE